MGMFRQTPHSHEKFLVSIGYIGLKYSTLFYEMQAKKRYEDYLYVAKRCRGLQFKEKMLSFLLEDKPILFTSQKELDE